MRLAFSRGGAGQPGGPAARAVRLRPQSGRGCAGAGGVAPGGVDGPAQPRRQPARAGHGLRHHGGGRGGDHGCCWAGGGGDPRPFDGRQGGDAAGAVGPASRGAAGGGGHRAGRLPLAFRRIRPGHGGRCRQRRPAPRRTRCWRRTCRTRPSDRSCCTISGPAQDGASGLAEIIASLPRIETWDVEPGSYTGPTLFVTGARSDYVKPEDRPAILRLFPAARFVAIKDAGHWLHAEQPASFNATVGAFLPA